MGTPACRSLSLCLRIGDVYQGLQPNPTRLHCVELGCLINVTMTNRQKQTVSVLREQRAYFAWHSELCFALRMAR